MKINGSIEDKEDEMEHYCIDVASGAVWGWFNSLNI